MVYQPIDSYPLPTAPGEITRPLAAVLPPAHEGQLFHYTNPIAAKGIIDDRRVWASHSSGMNDPRERDYGWQLIKNRFDSDPEAYLTVLKHPNLRASFERLFVTKSIRRRPDEESTWVPDAYIVCASEDRDDLNQYRLYGRICIELNNTPWIIARPTGEKEFAVLLDQAVWRPVLYGETEAQPYIDGMLHWVARIIGTANPDSIEDEPLRAARALSALATYIKPEDFKHENEFRLVFFDDIDYLNEELKTHATEDNIRPYVEVTSAKLNGIAIPPVLGITLGPGTANTPTRIAVQKLLEKSLQPSEGSLVDENGMILYPLFENFIEAPKPYVKLTEKQFVG